MHSLLLVTLVVAAEPTALLDSVPSIRVTGSGVSTAAPDKIDLFVQVVTEDVAVERAVNDNVARMNALLSVTRTHGVAPADVQLSSVSISARNEYEPNGNRIARTVQVVNKHFVVCLRTPAKLDALLIDLAKAKVLVGRIDFVSDTLKGTEEQLFVKAMESARKRGEAMAAAGGARLGRPLKVLTTREANGGSNGTATYSGAGGVSVGAGATGALSSTVTVAVDFELLPPGK